MNYKLGYWLTYTIGYWLNYKLGYWLTCKLGYLLTYKLGYWLNYKFGYWLTCKFGCWRLTYKLSYCLTYTLGYWLTYKLGYYLTNETYWDYYITTNSNWKRSYKHRIQIKLQTNLPRYISSFNEWTTDYTDLVISGRFKTIWPKYVGHRLNVTFESMYDWTVQFWCRGFGWGCTKRTLATRPG